MSEKSLSNSENKQLKEVLFFVFFLLKLTTCSSPFFSDLDDPIVTVHQSIGEAKEQFYYERTVFLRCVANSNPPVRYSWHRGREVLTQGSDKGVEIYEPFFTQVRQRQCGADRANEQTVIHAHRG